MTYTYEYERPSVTADVFVYDNLRDKFLVIKRGKDPYKGCWALPGGFMEMNELIVDTALRELKEETGLEKSDLINHDIYHLLYQDDPKRDTRTRVITFVFGCMIEPSKINKVKANDDAVEHKWVSVTEFLILKDMDNEYAFDHMGIIYMCLKQIKRI